MSETNLTEVYPLSKKKKQKGTRRMAREKILQIFIAYSTCQTDLDEMFNHIFFRIFNFEGGDDIVSDKLLHPDQVYEMEADLPISWNEEYIKFGKDLLHNSLKNATLVTSLIEKFAKNWELERIAFVDKALITIAVTEILDFPDIPPKVSINEAIEISKDYSTQKSKIFINGVLDSMLIEFKKEGKLNKTGRGLM